MQLLYLIEIFENNYNTVRDRFETDSVNVMMEISIYIKLAQSYQTLKVFANPYSFVINS